MSGQAATFVPDFLELGDEMAVMGTRNQARARLSGEYGVPYAKMQVRRVWMKPCDCEYCERGAANAGHGFDSFWVYADKGDEGAMPWWIG